MKGSYVLLIKLPNRRDIRVGGLGVLEFESGYYAYAGSALNGLEARIKRHLKSKKKVFWHIDYLLEFAMICDIYCKLAEKREECDMAREMEANFESIKNFGSGDCRCRSHLFYSEHENHLNDVIIGNGMKRRHLDDAF